MIDNKSIQRALKAMTFFEGPVDGIIGPLTHAAVQRALDKHFSTGKAIMGRWTQKRKMIAFQQLMMHNVGIEVGTIDGLWGPQSQYALEKWQNYLRAIPGTDAHSPKSSTVAVGDAPPINWPTQAEVSRYYGAIGSNLVEYTPPYQFKLYDGPKLANIITVHKKVVHSLDRVLNRVKSIYSPKDIQELRLDRFFGSYNPRKMRGGNSWSMHSWGIALDFDANRNQLRWGKDKAAFAKPQYEEWWKSWEIEGWLSLGRERNYDWMHVQAARL